MAKKQVIQPVEIIENIHHETMEEIMDEREERGDKVLVDDDEMLLLKNVLIV